jgi:serine protease Do
MQDPTRRRFLAATGGVMAALAGCSSGADDGTPTAAGTESPTATPATTAAPVPESMADSPFTRVYREVAPSVVRVRVHTADGIAQGSGVVWDERHLVTNGHVVAGGSEVTVVYTGGAYTSADVVGSDVYSDLAVLRVRAHPVDVPALTFADGDSAVGTQVIAIGSPLGLGVSVSEGIVSGVDRSLPAANGFRIPDAIQTDAAANPGNSGGPLVALDGTPLGLINSGTGNDIAFAISGALMKRVVPALIADGEYEHTYVGVSLLDLEPALARTNDRDTLEGVYVDAVVSGAPADGVLRGSDDRAVAFGETVPVGGDVIVAIDGEATPDSAALGSYLALHTSPGDAIDVTVVREGSEETVSLTLGERPAP